MPVQHRFDLAELDPKAPDLHLMVEAPKELDVAVGQITRQIASLVQTGAGIFTERIRNEFLGRQLGAVQ